METIDNLKSKVTDQLETTKVGTSAKGILGVVSALLMATGVIGFIWDDEPGLFDVVEYTQQATAEIGVENVIGSATAVSYTHLTLPTIYSV